MPVEPVSPPLDELPLPELRLDEEPLAGSPWVRTVSLPRFKVAASWALKVSPFLVPEAEEDDVLPEVNKELDKELDEEPEAKPEA